MAGGTTPMAGRAAPWVPGGAGQGAALVDRVLSVEPGVRAVGLKLVSANEPCFAGHFPGAPVLPAVLLCDALVQLAGRVASVEGGLRLLAVERGRFRRPVLPGDVLQLEVKQVGSGPRWRMKGLATAGRAVVAEVDFAAGVPEGPRVHPTAIVAAGAELAPGVVVGAYSVIGPEVRIGADSWIGSHAVVEGRTTIGARNRIFQFASVGAIPQDLKYQGEPSTLEMGDGNTVREFASISPGTAGGGMRTRIGSGCLLMVSSHVGHDCRVGDHVVLANGAALGGHVEVDDYAIVGGLAGVHQFVRIGESALCAAGAMVSLDVPPFCIAAGDRARLHGLNRVGLQRRGFGPEVVAALRRAYRLLFQGSGGRQEALARVAQQFDGVAAVRRLVDFVTSSRRGVAR
jgi:UDP-N-acetylglucosamine acyltransferase